MTAGDYYSFQLAQGQTATLALYSTATDKATVALYNPSQTRVALGAVAGNASAVINNFVAPATGTYYAQVTSGTGVAYDLVVGRGLGFDTESNDTFGTAQDIGPASNGASTVLGSIGTGSPAAYYAWDYLSSSLFTVTAATGAVTLLGPSGLDAFICGLAYDPNHGILYGTDSASLYSFDMTTGAGTLIGALSLPISFGLTYDPANNMLYSADDSGTLVEIDPATLVCTDVSGTGNGLPAYGIAYDPADHRIYCNTDSTPGVYSYDAVTYAGPVNNATPTACPTTE